MTINPAFIKVIPDDAKIVILLARPVESEDPIRAQFRATQQVTIVPPLPLKKSFEPADFYYGLLNWDGRTMARANYEPSTLPQPLPLQSLYLTVYSRWYFSNLCYISMLKPSTLWAFDSISNTSRYANCVQLQDAAFYGDIMWGRSSILSQFTNIPMCEFPSVTPEKRIIQPVDFATITRTAHKLECPRLLMLPYCPIFQPIWNEIVPHDPSSLPQAYFWDYDDGSENNLRTHWGQLKLLLTEIEFLTLAAQKLDSFGPDITVLYVGAGPGNHIPFLIKLFPMLKFELWDATSFVPTLKEGPQLRLHRRYFLDSDVAAYDGKKTLFICDIRTRDVKTNFVSTESKIDDHALQLRWVEMLQPLGSMLKFSPQYDTNEDTLYEYLDGTLYMQAYMGRSSTESRLISFGPTQRSTYRIRAYENFYAYFNNTVRSIILPTTVVAQWFDVEPREVDFYHNNTVDYDAWRMMRSLRSLHSLRSHLGRSVFDSTPSAKIHSSLAQKTPIEIMRAFTKMMGREI